MRHLALAALLALLACGCAARFSAGAVRNEIVVQQGRQPLGLYEINLGRFTTSLLKHVMTSPDGEVPFQGLRELELAIFDTESDAGPAIDVTLMDTRGWEPVVRILDGRSSAMVLVRELDDLAIGDLVVVAAGERKVVFGRLQGSLDRRLPEALGEAFRSEGTDGLRSVFDRLAAESDED